MPDLNALIAAAIPVNPPDSWFENPNLEHAHPIKVDSDGRVYGHVAAWNMDHIGMPFGTRPPRSRTDYAYFKTGELELASGNLIAVGQLTLAGGHAGLEASAEEAVRHYDDTASAIADVTAGEDAHGIWVAGALRSHASPEQVRALRASAPSGDWRQINGRLEMVAVCQVNVPGFPVTRSRVASGAPVALVAAGTAPLLAQLAVDPGYLERLGQLEVAALAEANAADQWSLAASAVRERVDSVRIDRLRREAAQAALRVRDPQRARELSRSALLAAGSREVPPKSARDAMERALSWVAEGKGGDGLEPTTVRRARSMMKGTKPSDATIKRMASFFARHHVDSKADGWNSGSEHYPSAGRVAWDLWGGDAGARWAEARTAALTAAAPKTAQREKLAKSGKALPDGSYPISTAAELKDAISAYGRAKDQDRAKRHIKKRARALNRTDLLPEAWTASGNFKHLDHTYLSDKADVQERDRFGKFIPENGLVRFKDRDQQQRFGRVKGMKNKLMQVQLEDGTIRSVRPKELETVLAVLPDDVPANESAVPPVAEFTPISSGDAGNTPLRIGQLEAGETVELTRDGVAGTFTVEQPHNGTSIVLRDAQNNRFTWAVESGVTVTRNLAGGNLEQVGMVSAAGTIVELPVGRDLTFYAVSSELGWDLLDAQHRTFASVPFDGQSSDEELRDVVVDEYRARTEDRPELTEELIAKATSLAAARALDDADSDSDFADDYRDWETEVAQLQEHLGAPMTDTEYELLEELGVFSEDTSADLDAEDVYQNY